MAWERKTPFGYMIQNGETVTCPKEAGAVRGIFTRYLAGTSYAKIAEEMSKGSGPYLFPTDGAYARQDTPTRSNAPKSSQDPRSHIEFANSHKN